MAQSSSVGKASRLASVIIRPCGLQFKFASMKTRFEKGSFSETLSRSRLRLDEPHRIRPIAAIGHEAHTGKPKDEHRPGRGLRNSRRELDRLDDVVAALSVCEGGAERQHNTRTERVQSCGLRRIKPENDPGATGSVSFVGDEHVGEVGCKCSELRSRRTEGDRKSVV